MPIVQHAGVNNLPDADVRSACQSDGSGTRKLTGRRRARAWRRIFGNRWLTSLHLPCATSANSSCEEITVNRPGNPGASGIPGAVQVVLWDKGARWGGQQDQADPLSGGDAGERSRQPGVGGSAAWRGDAGPGRLGLYGANRLNRIFGFTKVR